MYLIVLLNRGEEFVAHTKCITEDERYAAKGTYANGIVKKGDVKQESWVEMIKSIIDKERNLPPNHRNLLNTISTYNNVPRKKIKFIVSVSIFFLKEVFLITICINYRILLRAPQVVG